MTEVLHLRQLAWALLEISRAAPNERLRARLGQLSRECELLSVEMLAAISREQAKQRAKVA